MTEPCTILIVDDEPGIVRLLSDWLTEDFAPCVILAAGSLEEGIALAQEHHPMAIILDMGLPGTQGFATVQTFHQQVPTYPIVVISGLDDPDVQSQVLALRLSYHPKPLNRVTLVEAIRAQLAEQAKEQATLSPLAAVTAKLSERDPTADAAHPG